MKKLIAITALCLSTSAFAVDVTPPVHYFKNNSLKLELNTESLSGDIKNLDYDFKFSLKTNFNNNFYSSVNVIKSNKADVSYGVTTGVQELYKDVTPYGEVSYEHHPSDPKNVTSKQFDYDTGVKLNYFDRLSPYIEADDYVDQDRFFVKTGVTYTVDDRFYIVADYSFPSKEKGNSLGFGLGVKL